MPVSRGGRRRFLWTQQVDAAAGVGEEEETRGGESNRARAEEQWREEEERVAEGPTDRAIYKDELISGREKRGDHGVVISP